MKTLIITFTAIALLAMVGAFLIGRYLFPKIVYSTEVKVEYIRLPYKVTDSIPYPIPYKVEVKIRDSLDLKNTLFSLDQIKDSLVVARLEISRLKQEIGDTVAGYKDWLSARHYKQTLFDNDSIGKFDLSWYNQFNRSWSVSYEYLPIQKQVTVLQTVPPKSLSLFVFGGMGTDGSFKIGPGIFYKRIGIQYDYRYKKGTSAIHELGVGLKIR
jgi:hypothetical protein